VYRGGVQPARFDLDHFGKYSKLHVVSGKKVFKPLIFKGVFSLLCLGFMNKMAQVLRRIENIFWKTFNTIKTPCYGSVEVGCFYEK
jgi:hypothetical protein